MIELLLQAERALAVGQLDQAERLYRQAADLDHRNSIAVVGLARVALERADDAGALALGRRALEIDPENSAARRLVDRLEEVMRHRGEDPGDAYAPPDPAPADRAAPPPDAAVTTPDAAVATPDRAAPRLDAAVTTPGRAAPPPDAAVTTPGRAAPRRRRSLLDRILRRR